ncbi:calcium-dependent phosphotriesterase [Schizophyllum commune Tattone D]|nr:calcium-dependent phosphotriesterase [Schizophyllum commune Tattone D]
MGLPIPETLQNTNGGTGRYFGDILLATSGRGNLPPSLVRVNPAAPYNTTVILDNFFGRRFNSLNDVKVHPKTGKILFTDVTYGFLSGFRPEPQMPNQVYVLDPTTGSVRVVADGFVRCNGIALTPDGETAYVTDTGAGGGIWGTNSTLPATIYAYDVHPKTHALFAYTDAGIADGIQVDADGNVYAGCGDGTQVWDQDGTLLSKFFLGTTSANMIFAGDGRLLILAEQKVYYAKIAARAGVVEYPPKEPKNVTQGMVDQVLAMFPDMPPDNVRFDLLRTGSVELTTNKILERGFLDPPSQAYYTLYPRQDQPAAPSTTNATAQSTTTARAAPKNLIARYNLEERLKKDAASEPAPTTADPGGKAPWEESAEKREASLRERKAQMILAARQRLLAAQKGKVAEGKTA